MAEFQELIKNFNRVRDYMRQFYIYGFKVRNDFDTKSARTYDNERRRIESWLADYVKSDYTKKGKQVYISVDSRAIAENPLYAAWKAKSFTDRDLLLHFFILDLLWDCEPGMTAGELSDEIAIVYGTAFDSQLVRLKLKEYEELQLLRSVKEGKLLYYRLAEPLWIERNTAACKTDTADHEPSPAIWDRLIDAVKFFQGAAPFGFIGSTILDRENVRNDRFWFKHHFIVHTLEDGVLREILTAMEQHRGVKLENRSSRSGMVSTIRGIPLKIFVSTQTGRRYLCLYLPYTRRFNNVRLDCIAEVSMQEVCLEYEELREKLERNREQCWGVSFGGRSRLEELYMKLFIDEETEAYIIRRLHREGRGGEVLRIRRNEYLYSGTFYDTNEMLSWVKSFTGRILDIQGTNETAVSKVTRDWDKMYAMYCGEENTDGTVR